MMMKRISLSKNVLLTSLVSIINNRLPANGKSNKAKKDRVDVQKAGRWMHHPVDKIRYYFRKSRHGFREVVADVRGATYFRYQTLPYL